MIYLYTLNHSSQSFLLEVLECLENQRSLSRYPIGSLKVAWSVSECNGVAWYRCGNQEICKVRLSPRSVSECNGVEYDKNTHICCKGVISERPSDVPQAYQGCCATQVINTYSSICCEGDVKTKLNDEYRCCVAEPFDRTTDMCCSGTVNSRPNPDYRCCGTLAFDKTVAKCRDGVIVEGEPSFGATTSIFTSPSEPTSTTVPLPVTTYDPARPPASMCLI